MATFYCSGCSDAIPPNKARIHCQSCHNYDICANCYTVENFSKDHVSSHPTSLYRTSGYSRPPPPPPPLPPRRVSTGPAIAQNAQQPGPSSPQASGSTRPQWMPLFNPNTMPTSTFMVLMEAIFTHLDTSRTGHLRPETYSAFLDVQGYDLQQNVSTPYLTNPIITTREKEPHPGIRHQQRSHGRHPTQTSLRQLLNRPYNPTPQHYYHPPPNPNPRNITTFLSQICHSKSPYTSNNQMPLLTLRGFTDFTALELLCDPSKGWGNLNRALRHYGIWRDRGDIPCSMLPEFPPEQVLQRVRQVSELVKLRDEEIMASTAARLKLEAQGRQHAVDLLDDRRYVYY
ncbi:MAG: hypothetical protein M1834_001898 [Cirrosporium novae-zelandiae]|nr:MAG: hypothetical protein M1834_001898 [Cirrosporium novae-zelandiae]